VRLNAEEGGPSFFEWGSRFLNELLPWGDSSKGLWAGKRDAMVEKCVRPSVDAVVGVDAPLRSLFHCPLLPPPPH
jgi:hypothetical protein